MEPEETRGPAMKQTRKTRSYPTNIPLETQFRFGKCPMTTSKSVRKKEIFIPLPSLIGENL